MNTNKLKYFSYSILVGLIIYITAILWSLRDQNTLDKFSKIPLSLYFLLAFFSLSNYFIRFIRWLQFIKPMNTSISIQKHLLIYLGGFALTTTPGKAGESMRSIYLKPLGISLPNSLGALFSERLLDVVSVSFLSILLFSFSFPEFKIWVFSGSAFILSVFLIARSKYLVLITEKILKHSSKEHLILFQKTIINLLSNRSLLTALPLSLLAWGLQSIGLVFTVDYLGFSTDNTFIIMGIYNISILAGALSFIPGGIGATEASISFFLTTLGIDLPSAILASILVRGMTLWFAVALGAICLFLYNKYHIN